MIKGNVFSVQLDCAVLKENVPGSAATKATSYTTSRNKKDIIMRKPRLQVSNVSYLYNISERRAQFQRAYHGSAADFEKFDTSKYGLSGAVSPSEIGRSGLKEEGRIWRSESNLYISQG